MSASNDAIASAIISHFDSVRIYIDLGLAGIVLVTYDTCLILDKEVEHIWRGQRKWHQRMLYVLTRYMQLFAAVLALGTINPVSDELYSSCMVRQCYGIPRSLGSYCLFNHEGICPLWEKQDHRRDNARGGHWNGPICCGNTRPAIGFNIMPINLPPPDNCGSVSNVNDSLDKILKITNAICPIVGLSLVTITTWQKTGLSHPSSEDGLSSRRPSLPQLIFEYGKSYYTSTSHQPPLAHHECAWVPGTIYFCVLKITKPGQLGITYVGNFDAPISAILTSRLLLDIYETEAKLQRGGASATASFSLNLNDSENVVHQRSFSVPQFVTSYGGPAHTSFADDEDLEGDGLESRAVGRVSDEATPSGSGVLARDGANMREAEPSITV
ncbi:hypothetical protein C8Q77DRAFT_1073647 [Trametes polyzona]|nr:hypothetical protein C8Q77DRAFT_1073647 [Trametes polyzona]